MRKILFVLSLCMMCTVGFAQQDDLSARVTKLENQLKQLENDMKKNYIDEPEKEKTIHDFKIFVTRAEGNLDTGEVLIYMTIVNEGIERSFCIYDGSITIGQHQNKPLGSYPGHFAGGNLHEMRMMRRTPCEYVIPVKVDQQTNLINGLLLRLFLEDLKFEDRFSYVPFGDISIKWTEE